MQMLSQLWLPILASAAAVWVVSAVAWMALPHHKKDHDPLPDEKGFQDYLTSAGIGPGVYGFPDFKSCKGEDAKAKWASGAPMGILTVWGKISMGRNMLLTFLVYLVVGVLIAYLGAAAFGSAPVSKTKVFQVLGTAGVLTYCFAFLPNGIWFGSKPRTMMMNVIDGIAYGLATGAVFAWLWPGA